MSELKVINAYQLTTNTEDSDVYIHNDDFGCGGVLVECYLKFEADKVIAELEESHKMEVGQFLILNREQANAANRLRDSMEQAIRRHKYKRCLAMVRWCNYLANYWECCQPFDCGMFIARAKFFRKWHKRWLEIAEKFNPNNSTAQ